jgi:hypothetical protein
VAGLDTPLRGYSTSGVLLIDHPVQRYLLLIE